MFLDGVQEQRTPEDPRLHVRDIYLAKKRVDGANGQRSSYKLDNCCSQKIVISE